MHEEKGTDADLLGRVAKLADLLAYQEGAVISRTIIGKKVGTVTLFAFAVGEGLSEHTAPYDALVYAVDGDVEVLIAGAPHQLHKGELIIMPAGKPHALRALTPFKMLLVMIRA